jgi:hypothetical protein
MAGLAASPRQNQTLAGLRADGPKRVPSIDTSPFSFGFGFIRMLQRIGHMRLRSPS